ncbi:hypothetical protein DPMN_024802 [Dreissena polymorpha]|uniref:Uncharacterized protein n=1 Tax=Dreissena polymorpha TaxID=45954 RepID=A0A9D4LPL1_DREPO|nr:hypothetical protein DPMN_024802 [Dreissena polymorpha]
MAFRVTLKTHIRLDLDIIKSNTKFDRDLAINGPSRVLRDGLVDGLGEGMGDRMGDWLGYGLGDGMGDGIAVVRQWCGVSAGRCANADSLMHTCIGANCGHRSGIQTCKHLFPLMEEYDIYIIVCDSALWL